MKAPGYLLLLVLLAAAPLRGASTSNNDSCDISTLPAATLLLPYFEVDLGNPATTTLFTVQNVSPQPRIANVTLWTDWAFPALSFPIYLTGYDVQPINLYDVLASGTIAQGAPPPAACIVPSSIPAAQLRGLQLVFTVGRGNGVPPVCTLANDVEAQVGGVHQHAIGYATIDLVSGCGAGNPSTPGYFSGILFDNVLTGDVQQLTTDGATRWASSGPLVHIRAVSAPLPYTFYDRYTPAALKGADRRQPLSSAFAPRVIQGGSGGFNTRLTIWREAASAGPACADTAANSNMHVTDAVRFDEHEDATMAGVCDVLCPPSVPGLPATSSVPVFSALFPPPSDSGDVGGWIYLNLDNGSSQSRASQNWVVTSMFASPTYAVQSAAPALGNGCSPAVSKNATIGPAP